MFKCGIDIGGTNIKIAFFEEDKEQFIQIKTPKEMDEFIPLIKKTILKYHSLNEIIGYVVSIPGVVENGVVVYAPNTNILGLNIESNIKKQLQNNNVIIENDANIQAMTESRITGLNDLILLTIGTGLGGGIIIDGKLLNKNGYAGEVGHIKVHFGKNSRRCGCGKLGCVEAYVSARAIVKDYNDTKNVSINSKNLIDLAKKGDKLALKCIADCARYLSVAIADIVSVTGIKNIRIAGGLSNAGDYFIRFVRKYYPNYSVLNMEQVSIEAATYRSKTGSYAAKYIL